MIQNLRLNLNLRLTRKRKKKKRRKAEKSNQKKLIKTKKMRKMGRKE